MSYPVRVYPFKLSGGFEPISSPKPAKEGATPPFFRRTESQRYEGQRDAGPVGPVRPTSCPRRSRRRLRGFDRRGKGGACPSTHGADTGQTRRRISANCPYVGLIEASGAFHA